MNTDGFVCRDPGHCGIDRCGRRAVVGLCHCC